MGIDWIAHNPEEEQTDSNQVTTVFRGEALNDTALPEAILTEIYVDKSPMQMDAFADRLLNELEQHENTYTKYDKEIIENAVEWLRYWSENECYLKVWQ